MGKSAKLMKRPSKAQKTASSLSKAVAQAGSAKAAAAPPPAQTQGGGGGPKKRNTLRAKLDKKSDK